MYFASDDRFRLNPDVRRSRANGSDLPQQSLATPRID